MMFVTVGIVSIPLVTVSVAASPESSPAPNLGVRPSPAATEVDKTRSRLDELFIWKASEELKLTPEVEQKFTDIIRELGARKRQAAQQMEKVVAELDAAKTKPQAEKALARLRDAINEYHAIQIAEVDRLKPLLGPEKLARYFVVKDALSAKLKAMLSAPSANPAPAPSAK